MEESQADLLNLSLSPGPASVPKKDIGVDLLNVGNSPFEQRVPDPVNLLDINTTENTLNDVFGGAKPQPIPAKQPDVLDLLGDLNSFSAPSVDTKKNVKSNVIFDPFDFGTNTSQDTLFSSTIGSSNFTGNTGNFLGNAANMQRNVSTPNLTSDVYSNFGEFRIGFTC